LCDIIAWKFVVWEEVAWHANIALSFSVISWASSTIRCQRWWHGFALKVIIVLAVALATWVVHACTKVGDNFVVRVSRSSKPIRRLCFGHPEIVLSAYNTVGTIAIETVFIVEPVWAVLTPLWILVFISLARLRFLLCAIPLRFIAWALNFGWRASYRVHVEISIELQALTRKE
jgi:hypothetical protein